jgi:hypothetical protein
MTGWILIDEYYKALQQELEARHSRQELLRQYQATWSDEEWDSMGNRRKLRSSTNRRNGSNLTRRMDEIQNTFAGQYNAYICQKCDKGFLTLDVDPGVTPFMIQCLATEGCNGMAHSQMYPEGDPPADLGEPIIYWVKPTDTEFAKLPPLLVEHVEKGGLLMKATDAAPDWVKERTLL